MFTLLLFIAAIAAGAVASVAGFGIGSLLTPLLATSVGTRLAVAAISMPHFIGTAIRFWGLRGHVDRRVLWSFGITSAAGGLLGALLQSRAPSRELTIIFGLLLIFVGISGLTGLAQRMRFHGPMAWIAGAVSGTFGGLVGNQGGIRSAALLGFDLTRDTFVATATAIGLFVDGSRMPVYVATQHAELLGIWPMIAITAAGVVLGTLFGSRLLRKIPEKPFRTIVSLLILALGVYMLSSSIRL
jgi:uncharacterized membrane protein YfcA